MRNLVVIGAPHQFLHIISHGPRADAGDTHPDLLRVTGGFVMHRQFAPLRRDFQHCPLPGGRMVGRDRRTGIELNRHLQAEKLIRLTLLRVIRAIAAGRRGIGELVEVRTRRVRLE
ncbi:hypothetical protein D9M71_734030 [compost metagenome]